MTVALSPAGSLNVILSRSRLSSHSWRHCRQPISHSTPTLSQSPFIECFRAQSPSNLQPRVLDSLAAIRGRNGDRRLPNSTPTPTFSSMRAEGWQKKTQGATRQWVWDLIITSVNPSPPPSPNDRCFEPPDVSNPFVVNGNTEWHPRVEEEREGEGRGKGPHFKMNGFEKHVMSWIGRRRLLFIFYFSLYWQRPKWHLFCSFVLFSIEPTGFRVVLKPKSLCLPDVFVQAQCGLYGRIDIGAGSRIECYGPVSWEVLLYRFYVTRCLCQYSLFCCFRIGFMLRCRCLELSWTHASMKSQHWFLFCFSYSDIDDAKIFQYAKGRLHNFCFARGAEYRALNDKFWYEMMSYLCILMKLCSLTPRFRGV